MRFDNICKLVINGLIAKILRPQNNSVLQQLLWEQNSDNFATLRRDNSLLLFSQGHDDSRDISE